MTIYLTAEQVLFIHYRLLNETGGEHGVRDIGLLESAIAHPRATFDRQELYIDIFEKAAALNGFARQQVRSASKLSADIPSFQSPI